MEIFGMWVVFNYGYIYVYVFEVIFGYGILFYGEVVSMGMVCVVKFVECLKWVLVEFVDW